jgi:hypothetical protein
MYFLSQHYIKEPFTQNTVHVKIGIQGRAQTFLCQELIFEQKKGKAVPVTGLEGP